MNKHAIIEQVCESLLDDRAEEARRLLQREYVFEPPARNFRRYTNLQKVTVFLRDGFVDRYSGEKLVFPAVLRILSKELPEEFPFHQNWKMSECHPAYWQLFPTIDHVVPVARGGADSESNWICTSQLRNSAKANWLLEELGWELKPPGSPDNWDGLTGWFVEYREEHPMVLEDKYIAAWSMALDRAKNI